MHVMQRHKSSLITKRKGGRFTESAWASSLRSFMQKLFYSLRSIIHSLAWISNYQMSFFFAAFQQLLWKIPHGTKKKNYLKKSPWWQQLVTPEGNMAFFCFLLSFCLLFGVINHRICRLKTALNIPLNLPLHPCAMCAQTACAGDFLVHGGMSWALPATASSAEKQARQTVCAIMISHCLVAHNACCGRWLGLSGWCHIVEWK